MKSLSTSEQMLKEKLLMIILIVFISFLLSCSKINDNPDNLKQDFSIYLLKDPNIKINDLLTLELVNQDSQALAKIELQKYPWLTDNDIQMYDFSSHLLYLKKSKYNFLPKPVNLEIPSSWFDQPFMVVTDGVRRYLGSFRSFMSNDVWPFPVIDCSYNYLYPEDLLVISWQLFNHNEEDNRHDDYVKEGLKKAGILHNGLILKLKNMDFPENSDTATVEYTFSLINDDLDDLYILDPDKMGSGLFHFYNIGPQFVRSGEAGVRTALFHKPIIPEPRDTWKADWFVKLRSGDSITRTASLRGYKYFPPGVYACELTYNSLKLSKDQRILLDGRYWIGPIKSNLIFLEF
jgi:hypothetical protein